jgi:A/G-specific adenine glycosylase
MMLQQTQVETVIPISTLSRSFRLDDLPLPGRREIGKVWVIRPCSQLHKAAQVVDDDLHGEWPHTVEGLMALPGIGRYTAGAIASLAFDVDAPVLDGNVIRVLCRLFAIERDPKDAKVREELWTIAESLLPRSAGIPMPAARHPDAVAWGTAGEFNEALMELGALICTPRHPRCNACPLAKYCEAKKRGLQDRLPIKTKRKPLPHYDVTAAVICRNGRILIAQRPLGGRLGGLWEFPGGKVEAGETLPQCLRREIKEELGIRIKVGRQITSIDHAYTHFKITLHAFECELVSGKPQALQVQDFKWVRMSELKRFAFARTDLRIIEALRSKT